MHARRPADTLWLFLGGDIQDVPGEICQTSGESSLC